MRTDCEQPGLVRLATGKGEISGTKYMKSATALGAACSAPKPKWMVGPFVSSAPLAAPATAASRRNTRRMKAEGRRKKHARPARPLSSVSSATQHIIRYDGIRCGSLTFLPPETTPNSGCHCSKFLRLNNKRKRKPQIDTDEHRFFRPGFFNRWMTASARATPSHLCPSVFICGCNAVV
jgi:hypothetical protein